MTPNPSRTRLLAHLLAATLALDALPASAAEAAAPAEPSVALLAEIPQSNKACLTCHGGLFNVAAFQKSVHKDLSCSDCHAGFELSAHKAEAQELPAEDQALLAKLKKKSTAPAALLSCRGCHEEAFTQLQGSIHGRWLREERPVPGPLCFDCHGSPHAVAPSQGSREESIHARSKRCVACHSDPAYVGKAGVDATVTASYRDSLHGRQVALGNERAPNCADCHGSHHVLAPDNPEATVFDAAHKAQICSKCHAGATASFASLITHKSLDKRENQGPRLIHTFFSWLTTLTLLGLFVHILLDASSEIRKRLARAHGQGELIPAHLPKAVRRFDIHQRIQHWLMLSGVVLLTLTGWPVRAAVLGPGQSLAALLGGPAVTALVHRLAAFLLITSSVYHLGYLTWLAKNRRLEFSMLPTPKDAIDAGQNILHFLGLAPKPKFGRFSYVEKFDYWAVFWGVAIMVGTGFVYWFPVQFANILPSWVIVSVQLAHGEEATLCALALFVWHFYNVHLKPSIFPMSWTWLDGQISIENLQEEHALEYEKLLAANAVPVKEEEP